MRTYQDWIEQQAKDAHCERRIEFERYWKPPPQPIEPPKPKPWSRPWGDVTQCKDGALKGRWIVWLIRTNKWLKKWHKRPQHIADFHSHDAARCFLAEILKQEWAKFHQWTKEDEDGT